MGKTYEAKVMTDDQDNSIGFTDHTGYFYPIDRGQMKPGIFHCDVPLSMHEVVELALRLDQIVKAGRGMGGQLSHDISSLKQRVSDLEKLNMGLWQVLGGDLEVEED